MDESIIKLIKRLHMNGRWEKETDMEIRGDRESNYTQDAGS